MCPTVFSVGLPVVGLRPQPERLLGLNLHPAVPYAAVIDTTSGSYRIGQAVAGLLLAVSVAIVIWKLASVPRRRERDRSRVQPMSYAALPYSHPVAEPGGWDAIAPPGARYAATVSTQQRRGPRRGYWIPAAVIVTIAAGGYLWQVVSPHHSSATAPTGTGVSPAAATAEPPPGPGQVYRSTDGGFAVRFVGAPVELDKTATTQVVTMSIHAMADRAHSSVVEGIDLSPDVPHGEIDNLLRGTIAGLTHAGGAITRESKSTFRDRPAYQADFAQSDGRTFPVEAVLYGSQRCYVLFAPSGPAFDALANSFVALP